MAIDYSNPSGLCQCGCGGKAIRKFVHGHNSRLRPVKDGGYQATHVPDSPFARINGRAMTHVLIAETALRKPLPKGAMVHHSDGDSRNNKNSNLVICQDKKYHALLHTRARIVRAGGDPDKQKICSTCREVLDLERFSQRRDSYSNGRTSVCRDCKNEYDRKRSAR